MKKRVSTFATICTEKLRKQKSCCQSVIAYLRKDKYKIEQPCNNFYKMETIPFSRNSSIITRNFAVKMQQDIFEKDCHYLIPENKNYQPIKVTDENELVNWGIGTYVIKSL